ncbi:MAG: hypothetical protein MI919_30815, partial [Holophagales bacterium]|nr:hypothetical protein [Holophagales bacterium]
TMTKPDELEVFGSAPVQPLGTVDGRDFYFRARHDAWSAEVADSLGMLPSDGFSGGLFRHGFQQKASYLALPRVNHLIEKSVDEYVRLREELPKVYFDVGFPEQGPTVLDVDGTALLALALHAPRTAKGAGCQARRPGEPCRNRPEEAEAP